MKGREKYGRKTAHNRKWFILFLVHKSNMHGLRDRESFGNVGIVWSWREAQKLSAIKLYSWGFVVSNL
jgi:hypothetical protein